MAENGAPIRTAQIREGFDGRIGIALPLPFLAGPVETVDGRVRQLLGVSKSPVAEEQDVRDKCVVMFEPITSANNQVLHTLLSSQLCQSLSLDAM